MVERYLPGITREQVMAAAVRAKATTTLVTEEGTPVRFLRSILVPEEEAVFCLFEGPDLEAVKQANERAEIPFDRILEALEVVAEDLTEARTERSESGGK